MSVGRIPPVVAAASMTLALTPDGPVLLGPEPVRAVAAVSADPLADEWRRRTQDALRVVDEAAQASIVGDGISEGVYRAHRIRLAAADRILGFRRGAMPLPSPADLGVPVETTLETRRFKVRWADGRVVQSPLTPLADPAQPDDDDVS